MKGFGGPTPQISQRDFWARTLTAVYIILLLTVVIVAWNRPWAVTFRTRLHKRLHWSSREKKISDPEAPNSEEPALATSSPPRPGKENGE